MNYRPFFVFLTLFVLVFALAYGHDYFNGYSGAPDSFGDCASTCHGSPGGTITVSGFPAEYDPGQSYEIMVAHSGGDPIANFNGTIKIGEGSVSAGTISSGTSTSTYSLGSETNGVHFATPNHSSGTFNWLAPAVGTGTVRLYLSGLQGDYFGVNTKHNLVATELGGFICGDVNGNGAINILDITYLIAYLYQGGPGPGPLASADVNGNGAVNILDITHLIAYLYQGGPAPNCQ